MTETRIDVAGLVGFRVVEVIPGAAPYKADCIVMEKDGVRVRLGPEMNYMAARTGTARDE